MKNSTLVKTALIAACLPVFAGCVERQVVYRDRPAYVAPGAPPPVASVVAAGDPAPPPPQAEVIPVATNPAFVWIGGGWEWRGRWVWTAGRWGSRPYPGAVWLRGGWVHRGHGRVWVAAHWR